MHGAQSYSRVFFRQAEKQHSGKHKAPLSKWESVTAAGSWAFLNALSRVVSVKQGIIYKLICLSPNSQADCSWQLLMWNYNFKANWLNNVCFQNNISNHTRELWILHMVKVLSTSSCIHAVYRSKRLDIDCGYSFTWTLFLGVHNFELNFLMHTALK